MSLPAHETLDSFRVDAFDVYAKYDTLLNVPGTPHYTTSLVDGSVVLGVHYLFIEKESTDLRRVIHCAPIHYYHRFKSWPLALGRQTDPNFNDGLHGSRNLINIREILEIREGELRQDGRVTFSSAKRRQGWNIVLAADSSTVTLESLTAASLCKKNKGNPTVRLDTIFSDPVVFERMVDPALVFATPGGCVFPLSDVFYFTRTCSKRNDAYFPVTGCCPEIKKLKGRVYRGVKH
ncbi:hypothetical protein C5749_01605 [Sphingobacterium gobiense]|uniref:Uncharacterized protein n=2 Tax=Sphingobacterium gobiense TaxID=1382456 RepID=A0A2S9JRU7_9SPHI|nr:hypothetical protein C5749_01605 [Sphingobacterium gobiense]